MKSTSAFSAAFPLDILVAEHQPDVSAETKEILYDLGYTPRTATTSMDVIRMTNDHQYDVILMDIRMPGLEAILTAPRSREDVRPIIIAVSGTASPDFEEACLQDRMDHCLTRPIGEDELLLQLKACSILAGKCIIR
jgi:CheY-like chemotaxis protein